MSKKQALTLIPAYGRKYETVQEAMQDWNDGKDFKILNGPYCSNRDLPALLMDFDTASIVFGDQAAFLF